MLRYFGKFLQVAGLIVLPWAMVMQLTAGLRAPTGNIDVSTMLLLMILGAGMFYLGRMLEGVGAR